MAESDSLRSKCTDVEHHEPDQRPKVEFNCSQRSDEQPLDERESAEESLTRWTSPMTPQTTVESPVTISMGSKNGATKEVNTPPSDRAITNPPIKLSPAADTEFRSTRRRVAPVVYNEDSESEYESLSVKKTQARHTAVVNRKRQPTRGSWSKNYLLTNKNSKLVSADLSKVFTMDAAWQCLNLQQQKHLVSMLPNHGRPELDENSNAEEPLANYLLSHLKTSSAFRADIRLFQEDLAAGKYDPRWVKEAATAMEKRAAGDFDAWKEENRESFWGQKQKVDHSALAGEGAQCSLPDLVKAGLFLVGDVWTLSRRTRKDKTILVEKEATITSIAEDHTLIFKFPPGQYKFSADANGEDIHISGIGNPFTLGAAMIQEDGRLVDVRSANSWKEFRCYRKNQDMGALFDIRELHHLRQSKD